MPKAPYYTSPLWQKPLRWGEAAVIYACAKGPPPLSPFAEGWWCGFKELPVDDCPYESFEEQMQWLLGWGECQLNRAEEPPEEDDPS